MKICVFGVGAIGGFLSASLARDVRNEVSAIARGNRLAAIQRDGLVVSVSGNIWNLPTNNLDITAVGSAQPLQNIKLPFLADVDKIFAVLQGSLTTVKVGGTLEAPTVTPGVFADLGQGLRKILLGDVQAETRGSAGQ